MVGGGLPSALREHFSQFEVGPKTRPFLPHLDGFQPLATLLNPPPPQPTGAAPKATKAWATPPRGGVLFSLGCSLSAGDFILPKGF